MDMVVIQAYFCNETGRLRESLKSTLYSQFKGSAYVVWYLCVRDVLDYCPSAITV